MISLGLVVTTGLRGTLEHWRARVIAWEKLTSFPESTGKAAAACLKVATARCLRGSSEVCLLQASVCSFPTSHEGKPLRGGSARRGEGEPSAWTEPTPILIAHRDFVNQRSFENRLQSWVNSLQISCIFPGREKQRTSLGFALPSINPTSCISREAFLSLLSHESKWGPPLLKSKNLPFLETERGSDQNAYLLHEFDQNFHLQESKVWFAFMYWSHKGSLLSQLIRKY